MRRIKILCFGVCVLVMSGLIGCFQESGLNNLNEDLLESGEFALLDFEDTMDAVENATLTSQMRVNPDLFNGNFFKDGGPFGRFGPKGPRGPRGFRGRSGNHLGKILRQLELSEEQRTQIRDLMAGHRECIQAPLQAFREANQDLIEAANEQRRIILEAMKNGEISRDDAKQQLRELSQATRAEIRNNPESQAIKDDLCNCKLSHFANIRGLLTEGQQASWDEWVANLENGCFGQG